MGILLFLSILVGIVGGICGIWSVFYARNQVQLARQQVRLMEKELNDRKKRDSEDDSWAQRFENLSRKLLRINPRLQVLEPGNTNATWIYTTMYQDPKLRLNIENFIIEVNAPGSLFLPRRPQPYEFRSPTVRETIERAEAEMEKFIKAHPFCKPHLLG